MSRLKAKIPPFNYLGGRDFTEKLKKVTGCKTFELMSDRYGVPNSTFSTWHTHNRTGFELIGIAIITVLEGSSGSPERF